MKLRHIIATLTICFFLTGCITFLQSLMPKVTPEQTAIIMAMAENVKFKKPKTIRKSKTEKMRLKKGQWVTTLSKSKAGDMDVALTTTKIISVQGRTVVLEIEKYSAAQNGECTISQITIENYPVKGQLSYSNAEYNSFINNMRITKLISKKGNGPAQETPPQMLSMMQGMTKGVVGNAIRVGEMRKSSCATEYLKSGRCYEFDFSASALGITVRGVVTANGSIPVNGMVKSDTNQMIEETIAFGYKGAKSKL